MNPEAEQDLDLDSEDWLVDKMATVDSPEDTPHLCLWCKHPPKREWMSYRGSICACEKHQPELDKLGGRFVGLRVYYVSRYEPQR